MPSETFLFFAIANRAYGGDPWVLEMLRVLFEREHLDARIELVPESQIMEAAASRKPSLILAGLRQIEPDGSMPEFGDDTLRALKSDPRTQDIPIMLLEALANIDEAAEDCRVDAYVGLPFGAPRIYPTVLRLIGLDREL